MFLFISHFGLCTLRSLVLSRQGSYGGRVCLRAQEIYVAVR
jgi:hypothetical protein